MFNFLFIQGAIIGLLIAMPLGPVDLLVIRNSITRGMLYGFVTGLGAAVTDGLFGALAGYGISEITEFLSKNDLYFRCAGAIFLVGIGTKILMSKSNQNESNVALDNEESYFKAFVTAFILTFTNPLTILSFVGIFAGFGVEIKNDIIQETTMLVCGILVGSCFWWFVLSGFASMCKNKINFKYLSLMNQISGVGLILFGIGALFI